MHVAAKDKGFGDAAEDWDGRGEAEDVAHLGLAGWEGAEVVVVLHGLEGASEHGVLEVGWWLVRGDPRGEALADEEVSRAPGDGVAECQQAFGGASERDGLFPEMSIACEVDFDGTGEVEAAGDGCGDEGGLFEGDHAVLRG